MPQTFTLSVPSRLEEVGRAEEAILGRAEHHQFGERERFAIKLALEEALANAIKHGNRFDPGRKVEIRCAIDGEKAEITVGDEGEGFELDAIPDPTRDENLEKPYGRGVMLMQAYMDEVRFEAGGTRVRMVKHRSSARASA